MSGWSQASALIGLLTNVRANRADLLYELVRRDNLVDPEGLYINMGYWAATTEAPAAFEALVDLVASRASVTEQDEVLDAGCGFGAQDRWLAERYAPRRLVGLNVSRCQLEVARARFGAPSIEYVAGDAARLDESLGLFDVVLSVESAYHFDTRADFLRGAFDRLRPGGRIALTDLLLKPVPRPSVRRRLRRLWMRRMYQIPAANVWDIDTYARTLEAIGFGDVRIEKQNRDVLRSFAAHMHRLADDPSACPEISRRVLRPWRAGANPLAELDYVLVSATKR